MPSENIQSRSSLDELAGRLRSSMSPIDKQFSWHALYPLAEEDMRPYLHDPIESLPPAVRELLPSQAGVVLAPYLEKGGGKDAAAVVDVKPADAKLALSARVEKDGFVTMFFTVKGEQVADYHYFFYDEIAALVSHRWPKKVEDSWYALLRDELSNEVHGEVDERSWHLKQALLRRPLKKRREGPQFQEYARQSFEDTMTLYLHGICCDIDVDTGPRQLPTRYVRKRLEALKELFPPPQGRAVFPEDLKKKKHGLRA